eukprot:143735-Prymnesium_polylepis.2
MMQIVAGIHLTCLHKCIVGCRVCRRPPDENADGRRSAVGFVDILVTPLAVLMAVGCMCGLLMAYSRVRALGPS